MLESDLAEVEIMTTSKVESKDTLDLSVFTGINKRQTYVTLSLSSNKGPIRGLWSAEAHDRRCKEPSAPVVGLQTSRGPAS